MTKYEHDYYSATGLMPDYDISHPAGDLWMWLEKYRPEFTREDRVWVDGGEWTPEFAAVLREWEQWGEAEALTPGLWA